MEQKVNEFVAKYNGQYIDEDKYYGSQCWDVVARYAREVWGCSPFPTISGGAEGLWRFYAQPIPQYFDKVPASDLQAGDICVWSGAFYAPYGHTSVVWRREGNTIWSFEQDGSKDPNGDGIADGVAYLTQRQIVSTMYGGLRPKGGIVEPADYRVNDGDIINIYVGMLGRKPSDEEIKIYQGKTYKTMLYAFMGSDEFKTRIKGDFERVGFDVYKPKSV